MKRITGMTNKIRRESWSRLIKVRLIARYCLLVTLAACESSVSNTIHHFGKSLDADNPDRCPEGLPPSTSCFSGQDSSGAYYLIAIPENWNQTLVVYDAGGPPLDPVRPLTAVTDLRPAYASQLLPDGFAVAATSYRRGGWFVTQDAQDTENLRQEFVGRFGSPKRTVALGASYGAMVTGKLVESFGVNRSNWSTNYDGALPLCGTMAGTRRHSYLLLDNRAVYQFYCGNHPRSGESTYPLWMGLPRGVTMTQQEVADRMNECTGIQLPASERSEDQRRNLANILSVLRRPEAGFVVQMWNGSTLGLQNIAQELLDDAGNPLPNRDVIYTGSDDDVALNAGVDRYESDPEAVRLLSVDGDLSGNVDIPVLTMHGITDGRVFVEHEHAYREAFERSGTLDHLLQTYVDTAPGAHCGFSVPEFQAVFYALLSWIDSGNRPTSAQVASSCEKYREVLGGECRFDPSYSPSSYESRVYPRQP